MAGRPTDYSEEMLAQAKAYMLEGYREREEVVPSIAGLSRHLGKNRDTMYAWREAHPEWDELMGILLAHQEVIALNNGLTGKFNPAITKMVLANHGYSDRKEIDHTSGGDKFQPNRIEIVAATKE
jgi:hypothetical protein